MAGESCDITEDLFLSAEAPGPVVEPLAGNADDGVSIVENLEPEYKGHVPWGTDRYKIENLRHLAAERNKLLPWMFKLVVAILFVILLLLVVFARDFDDVSGTISSLLAIVSALIGGLVGYYFNKS